METIKRSAEYTIFKKRNERYSILNNDNKWVNGEEKVKILLKEKLIKLTAPKKKEEAAPEATAAPASEEKKAE